MARIHSKDTRPELAVRSMLHRLGFRFRLHRRDLPGTPDIVLPGLGAVVFVHGCFWHGHRCKLGKMPKSRIAYWDAKISANRVRDARVRRRLLRLGWKVVVVRECELRRPDALRAKLAQELDGRRRQARHIESAKVDRLENSVKGKSGKATAQARTKNRYEAIVAEVFRKHYRRGAQSIRFDREEFAEVAKSLRVALPKNLGDTIYSFKYRNPLPESIVSTAPEGWEWVISGVGRAKYEFRLVRPLALEPAKDRVVVKVPDATPEIIGAYALGDEQALLAKVRYNRLIDIFLGVAASSLQNHLRTTVKEIGQIEIDELYVGIDHRGAQYVVPVQAKGGKDRHGRQQTEQDLACCKEKFPTLICRAVSVQFLPGGRIAMFELGLQDDEVRVVAEEHYELVPASDIGEGDLALYARRPTKRQR